MSKYIISLDQGTTSSRAVLFDDLTNIVCCVQKEFRQIYPKEGWVEHDPMDLYASIYSVLMECIAKSGVDIKDILSIGITNQRETTILWDKISGKPIYNAIVWQCRRTSDMIDNIKDEEIKKYIKNNTGLLMDAYFSASKIQWILDNVPGARDKALNDELLFGTVDTWLIWKLTNGRVFKTDYTNASRTMLYNIKDLCWDERICKLFNVPTNILPTVCPSSHDYGSININGHNIPICGVAGDQQSALFGQACFNEGDVKNTYGTGCFLLMNTGEKMCLSNNGLITTIACSVDKINYALEGSIFVGGALIQWLRDEMHFITDAQDTEYFANRVKDNGGIYIVPAFTGLGAPYWDMHARGTIFGITRGTSRNHLIRASLEAIGFQTHDVLEVMEKETGIKINDLKVDGGASKNNFIMQFQADIINKQVIRPEVMESTALGVYFLSALKIGLFSSLEDIKNIWKVEKKYVPKDDINRDVLINKWHKAVNMSLGWDKD